MDTLTTAPLSPTLPADERIKARRALVDYFCSFGLTDPVQLSALAERFIREAQTAGDLTAAPRLAEQAVADWFAALLGPKLTKADLAVAVGRAAFLLCGAPAQWGNAFLDQAPDGLMAALRRATPVPAPEPIPVAMIEQPLQAPTLLPFFRRTAQTRIEQS